MAKRNNWRRATLLRLGGIVVGLLAALVLLEAMFWALDWGRPTIRSKRALVRRSDQSVVYHLYVANPHGEFSPAPDVSLGEQEWRMFNYTMAKQRQIPLAQIGETPWCVEYRRSSNLMRDREYDPGPPPGTLRIAAIGDSFVFGEGVPLESTLPRQMEALLGSRHEILNAGVPGFNTRMEREFLEHLVAAYHCTRAIFVFVLNDVLRVEALQARENFINDLVLVRDEYLRDYEAKAWYAGHIRLLHFIGTQRALRRIERETIQWYRDCYDSAMNAEGLHLLEEDIRRVAVLGECRVAFVIYPLMEGLERSYPFADIHERVAAIARKAGLPVMDLAPVFAGRKTSDMQVDSSDHHPNGKAHALAARAIVDWLRRDVPGFLDSPVYLPPDEPSK